MIAECVMRTEDERYEAMDLFRHATELQFHVSPNVFLNTFY